MMVNNSFGQTGNSEVQISSTGMLSVSGNMNLTNTGKLVVAGNLLIGGSLNGCGIFTVNAPAIVNIIGTSVKTPIVPEGASVTINGNIIS